MSWFLSERAPVAVPLGECLCPGTPHAGGDTVYLRAELDLAGGLAVIAAMSSGEGEALIERMGRAYLLAGIASWTFLDEAGVPVPATRENIDRLRWSAATLAIANAAADLYGEAVLDPLVETANASSPSGPSDASTSATPDSSA